MDQRLKTLQTTLQNQSKHIKKLELLIKKRSGCPPNHQAECICNYCRGSDIHEILQKNSADLIHLQFMLMLDRIKSSLYGNDNDNLFTQFACFCMQKKFTLESCYHVVNGASAPGLFLNGCVFWSERNITHILYYNGGYRLAYLDIDQIKEYDGVSNPNNTELSLLEEGEICETYTGDQEYYLFDKLDISYYINDDSIYKYSNRFYKKIECITPIFYAAWKIGN